LSGQPARTSPSFYDNPDLYDLVFGFRRVWRELDFTVGVYADIAGRPPRSVVDIACGTGRHVLEAARRGIDVVGLDSNPAMVSYAAGKAAAQGLDASFVVADMRALPFQGPFDCAICMFHTLPLLTTNEELLAHFEGVAQCLAPPGVYVVEMGNPRGSFVDIPHGSRETWDERCWSELRDGARIRATTYRDPPDLRHETMRVEMVVDLAAPGLSVRLSAVEIHRLLLPESLAAIAHAGGRFRLHGVYGGFSADQVFEASARSARMICVFVRDPARRSSRKEKALSSRSTQYGLRL